MSVVKPLLWLLEPYIVYKAYLWALRFIAHPVTWEGEIDLFSLTLTMLLILDAVVLPLVILYCPGLNHGKRVPDWIRRLGTPIYIVHNWLDDKVGGGTSTPIVWLRKTLHSLLVFIYLLIPLYVGGHLVMGLVVALMYDVLVVGLIQRRSRPLASRHHTPPCAHTRTSYMRATTRPITR